MKTFTQWAEQNKVELPIINEKRARTGYSANYPPAYVSGQYPDEWFFPVKATAPLDKEIMDKMKTKK